MNSNYGKTPDKGNKGKPERFADKPYAEEFVAMVLQGDKDLKEGKGIKITIEELINMSK